MFYSDNASYELLEVDDLHNFKGINAVSEISIWSDLSPSALKIFNLILLMTIFSYYANIITFDVFHALTGENWRKYRSVANELRNMEFFEYNPIRAEQIEKAFADINFYVSYGFSFSLSAELIRQLDYKLADFKLALCPNSFGMNVRYYRNRYGLTQEELAVKTGLCQKSIQSIERGKRNPSYKCLVSLCRALKCTPNDLMCAVHLGYRKNLPFLH